MANTPKDKAKATAVVAKKRATPASKKTTSRDKPKPTISSLKYVVSGTVLYADSTPAASLTVIAYDKDVSSKDSLGQSVVTNESGTFAIPYSEADFRRTDKERGGADVVVCVYDDRNGKHELLFSSKKKNNAPPKYELNITLPVEQFMVRGTVKDANLKPLAKMLVQVYERDLRILQLLGTAETDAGGGYRIDYRPKDFQLADVPLRRTPWLIVEVRASAGGAVLAKQEVQQAARDQIISFTLASVGSVSEWQRISDAVEPLLKGQGAASLEPNSQVIATEGKPDLQPFELNASDIGFIVLETKLDRTAVEAWASSNRMLQDAIGRLTEKFVEQQSALRGDGWQFFYSFARQSLARDLDAVLSESEARWLQAWRAAGSANRVSTPREKDVACVVDGLKLLQKLQQLEPGRSNSDLTRLLTDSPLPSAVALDALAIYQDKALTDAEALLELVKRHPEEEVPIKKFVRSVRVHQLTSGHHRFSNILNRRLKGESDSIAPLAALPSSDWMCMAAEAGIGAGLALQMQARVEKQHPLTALQAKLETGDFQLPGVANGEIAALVKNQGPTVEAILRGATKIKDTVDGEDSPVVHTVLRDVGRFLRTGVGMEMSVELIKNGVTSPGTAIRHGRDAIREHFNNLPQGAAHEVTESLFDFAEPILNSANGFVIDVAGVRALPAWTTASAMPPASDAVREGLPTLAGLFGDLDECICDPCESMLGQPAYLVDLLNLLGKTNAALLKLRRPGIFSLPLSCENADPERPIQHIEIALEILQEATGSDPYGETASSVYPWQLPFNLSRAEIKACLVKLGVSRLDLLAARAASQANELAAETLDLSFSSTVVTQGPISEWQLLTERRTGANLWAIYGFGTDSGITIIDPASGQRLTSQTVEDLLTRVSVLIDRTGLDLDVLEGAFKTQYVSGFQGGLTLINRDQCKTSEMRIPTESEEPILEGCLDRLHRFTRLLAKLPGWSVGQLDKAIAACDGLDFEETTDLDRANLLIKLATLKRLHDDHGIPLEHLFDLPTSTERLQKSLGLSLLQFGLLKALTALDLTSQLVNWEALEDFCNAAKRIRESGLSVEQVAQALLSRAKLKALAGELPPSIKTPAQIEQLLTAVQARLRSVAAVRTDMPLAAQATEALSAVLGASTAAKIIQAIESASAPLPTAPTGVLLDELCLKLSGATAAAPQLGEWLPLVSDAQARQLFSIASPNLGADARLRILLDAVARKRRERELTTIIAEHSGFSEVVAASLLGSRLGVEGSQFANAAEAFLDESFWDGENPPSVAAGSGAWLSGAFPQLYSWMDRLYRLVVLSTALNLDSELMRIGDRIAVGARTGINWRDLLATQPATGSEWSNPHWKALLDMVWLQQPERLSRPVFDELLARLETLGVDPVQNQTIRPLAARLGIAEEQALAIAAQAVPNLNALALRDPSKLRRVFELLLIAKQLGAGGQQLAQLANATDSVQTSSTAYGLLEARVGEQAWGKVLKSIQDSLRQQRRDALVAYLVNRDDDKNWRDANDLYEHYLIDPQMEPCFDTTRVLEAITATQLFTQRILFGLEKDASASAELKQRWTWMRNYRVWEANRKVFLFPENWLFPELRDDKSSSFKQLESALGQGELTQDLAVQSFGQFLDDVAQMGQVDVLGMFEDVSRNSEGSTQVDAQGIPVRRTLYVVGRSRNPPYAYFWRHSIDFGSAYMDWSPWQRIELDIQGDHVLPFVLGGQLYVAWPLIRRIKENSSGDSWEVKLAWSRYDGKNWRKSSISRDFWTDKASAFSDERRGFSFRCETALDGSTAKISVYALGGETGAVTTIDLTTEDPEPSLSNWGERNPIYAAIDQVADAKAFLTTLLRDDTNFHALPERTKKQIRIYEQIKINWTSPDLKWSTLHGMLKKNAAFGNRFTVFLYPDGSHPSNPQFTSNTSEEYEAWKPSGEPLNFLPSPEYREKFIEEFLDAALEDVGSPAQPDFRYFNYFFDTLKANSSRRTVICVGWIKLLAPDSAATVAYLPLTGNQSRFEGDYTCAIGPEVIDFVPGVPKAMEWRLGEQVGINCTLTLSLDKTTSTGATQRISLVSPLVPLVAIQSGYEATQTVHFVIDGTSHNGVPIKAIDIGFDLDAMKKLKLISAFKLTRGDSVSTISVANQNEIYNPVHDSLPWMNGFRERSTAQGVLPLQIANYSNTTTPVFLPTKPSPFWIIGSATGREVESDRRPVDIPAAWHYSENGFDCYIDLGLGNRAVPADGDLFVYADSYPEATLRRSEWSQYQTLPSTQQSTFGAEEFPVPGTGTAALWTDTVDGKLAFDVRLPYACYNWEVFFHAPLLIADQLSKQHKFEDAERWLRYVFDPTSGGPEIDATRFLKFRPFKEPSLTQQVVDDLTALAQAAHGLATDTDIAAVSRLIGRWRDAPFRPFLIARRRHVAFLWRTLFAYLDNLIAWADSLYRRDTIESINEATMLYVLAERILGRRPQLHAGKSNRAARNYDQMAGDWDDFANFWIDTAAGAGDNLPVTSRLEGEKGQPNPDGSLLFCMPFNDKILSYWSLIDSRLFNVRNCRNIEGIKRTLPLMDAPIDPELLVRATAFGLDLKDVISGLYAPLPHYRYGILSARAAELAGETKALGAAMLSAIEKRDAEHLAQLRSSNEISLLKLVQEVRTLQITEAESNVKALRGSRKTIESRYNQYQRLLGKKDIKIPEEGKSAGEESMLGSVDSGLASNRSNWGLIKEESEQYVGFEMASGWSIAAGIAKTSSGVTHALGALVAPVPGDKAPYMAFSAVAHGLSAVGDGFSTVSQGWRSHAEQQGTMAGHIRRRDEWAFQSNQTLKELQQIDKQILANQIRIDITKKELSNHVEQMEQAKAIDDVMRSKFSNEQLYEWMRTQLYGLYSNAYRMALEMARRAERAAARELGVKPLNILRNDHWDSLRDGLLAGERLHQDIKRLEVAYLDQNRREFELTKHVSLRRLNPNALVNLRVTQTESIHKHNSCEFDVPEWLFDLDTPGHYLRRIKSVSVSIPGVIGPYTSVNCKLTLLSSHVRHESTITPQYARVPPADDPRFTDYYGASEAIVTSTGNGDSGLFETQLRDERFLPFEGSGVISKWRLELPGEYPQFDYSTISDVVLTIRYTARDGGDSLRDAATISIGQQLTPTQTTGSQATPLRFPVLLSCRYDYPTEWARAKTDGGSDLSIHVKKSALPYWMDAARMSFKEVKTWKMRQPQTGEPDFQVTNSRAASDGGVELNLGPVDGVDQFLLLEVGI